MTDRASNIVRVWSAVVLSGCLGLLVYAARLAPDPSGIGTHKQMGLRVCPSIAEGRGPCISCGMTTSVALAANGRVLAAFVAQPAGALLAMTLGCGVWVAGYGLLTGNREIGRLRALVRPATGVVIASVLMASWGYKIVVFGNG